MNVRISLPPIKNILRKSYKRSRKDVDIPVFQKGLELLRNKRGAFRAAQSTDYDACWIRDQLYANLCYFYTGEHAKAREGVWVVFDILHKHFEKIERAVCDTPKEVHDHIHAKFHADTFDEVTRNWGHHQLDAIGLFLFIVGFAHERGVKILRDAKDKDLIQLLVFYVNTVRYWENPDNGMWEEGMDLHASSIGAVLAGLSKIREQHIAHVPDVLIRRGREALFAILPNETKDRNEDMAQLSLVFPYNIVPKEVGELIIRRVMTRLSVAHGLNRYWDDNYYRSENGVSAEWPMGFFWLSIVFSEVGAHDLALHWYREGKKQMTEEGHIPELYQNDAPNGNTPLAWAHSLAIIAASKVGKGG